ncbi:torsin-1A-interacting protein 2 [Procambarus clarkii]|uniref:torsin-1A-interacting protein 2 n=1 Tax=Procambarus clarkii TaxID=6728 RepID=UPI0037438187
MHNRVNTRPTPRPGLHENDSPPSKGVKSPHTRSRINVGQSPKHRKTKDEIDSDEEAVDATHIDEVDQRTPKSPKLYPALSEADLDEYQTLPNLSPSHLDFISPNDTIASNRSQCHSRTGSRSLRKDLPVTPVKGSPDKKLYCDLPPKDVKDHKKGASPMMMILLFFCLIMLVSVSVFICLKETDNLQAPKPRIKPITEVYEDLKTDLKYLNVQFSQPRNLWIQLIGQMESIMVDSPSQPAIILVVVPEDAQGTATCLIHKIAEAIKEAFEGSRFVMFDVKSDAVGHHPTLKMEFDNVLRGLRDAHAAVIHNIEQLPGEAAMMFHAYCDNENAPFKQVVLFPMVEVQSRYEEFVNKRLDITVDNLLMEIWGSELKEKDVSAVVSRIANAPVLIKPESRVTIQELCPI